MSRIGDFLEIQGTSEYMQITRFLNGAEVYHPPLSSFRCFLAMLFNHSVFSPPSSGLELANALPLVIEPPLDGTHYPRQPTTVVIVLLYSGPKQSHIALSMHSNRASTREVLGYRTLFSL